jgi:hypothetical protein
MKTAATALAVLATVALAACGGGSSGSTNSSTSTNPAGGPQRFTLTADQRACMEKNGAPAPPASGPTTQIGPPPGAAGAPPAGARGGFQGNPQAFAKVRAAAQKCGVSLPQGGPGGTQGTPPDVSSAPFQASVKDYVTCMADNGYTMPAPNFSGNGPVFDQAKVNRNDPKFTTASAKCQSKLAPPGGQVQVGGGAPAS